VTPRYFEAFRIPVVRGRTFREADWAGEPGRRAQQKPLYAYSSADSPPSGDASGSGRDRLSARPRWIVGGVLCARLDGHRVLQSQLYQVGALDPWPWTGALLALAVVLVMAVLRPVFRPR